MTYPFLPKLYHLLQQFRFLEQRGDKDNKVALQVVWKVKFVLDTEFEYFFLCIQMMLMPNGPIWTPQQLFWRRTQIWGA